MTQRLFSTTPPPAHAQNPEQENAASLYAICTAVSVLAPGAAVGAVLTWAAWRATRPPALSRVLIAGLGLASAMAFHSAIIIGGIWRLVVNGFYPTLRPDQTGLALLHSFAVELLLGPALLLCFVVADYSRRRTLLGQVTSQSRSMAERKKALDRGWRPSTSRTGNGQDWQHPAGYVRLGVDAESNRYFDIGADELVQHVFVPGAAGYGKTTTLVRLADGAVANGYGVVVIDCKGVGLGGEARNLAARYQLPYTVIDPDDPSSVGYNPCSGDAAGVANKIIGAFSFGDNAEIYKQIAMEVVPVICRALIASHREVTLDRIYDALDPNGGLSELGRRRGASRYRDRLEDLENAGGVAAAGYIGLRHRLGALMEGKFGQLFRKRPALDWDAVTSGQQVTYVSLSATATGEDVELFGRVITQDLKQLCDRRMREIEQGGNPTPVLVIYDEFAALREAQQIVDLLLQARQARTPIVVATQYLPENIPIRTPVLSAGVLICHRVAHNDAEQLANEMGTRKVPFVTSQVDYETGESEKGSIRMVDEFNIHPNVLRTLPVGRAVVYARRTERRSLVQVHRQEG
jgi:hypothetical protein